MNISEIARLAGVAPATVSRYLNNGYVSAEKKEKIRRIIAETGYKPRVSSPSANSARSNLVAAIIPGLKYDYVNMMVESASEELCRIGIQTVLVMTGGNPERELEQLRLLQSGKSDGVIFYSRSITDAHSHLIASYGKPIVVVGQYEKNSPCVYFDDYKAAYTGVRHLAALGCKRIAHIYSSITNNHAGHSRMDGCFDALRDSGLRYSESLMREAELSYKGGRAAMQKLLSSGTRFDGLLLAEGSITVGALRLLQERGGSIGDEIKAVTVGNTSQVSAFFPSVSMIKYNYAAAGREAGRILLERINGDTQITKQYKLGFDLIERDKAR